MKRLDVGATRMSKSDGNLGLNPPPSSYGVFSVVIDSILFVTLEATLRKSWGDPLT